MTGWFSYKFTEITFLLLTIEKIERVSDVGWRVWFYSMIKKTFFIFFICFYLLPPVKQPVIPVIPVIFTLSILYFSIKRDDGLGDGLSVGWRVESDTLILWMIRILCVYPLSLRWFRLCFVCLLLFRLCIHCNYARLCGI